MQHSPEKKYAKFAVHLCYRYCCIGNPHQKLWLLKTFYLTFNLVIKLIVADYVGARKTQIGLHPMYKFGAFFVFFVCFFGFLFVCGCSSVALYVVRTLWWINFLSLWKCLFFYILMQTIFTHNLVYVRFIHDSISVLRFEIFWNHIFGYFKINNVFVPIYSCWYIMGFTSNVSEV